MVINIPEGTKKSTLVTKGDLNNYDSIIDTMPQFDFTILSTQNANSLCFLFSYVFFIKNYLFYFFFFFKYPPLQKLGVYGSILVLLSESTHIIKSYYNNYMYSLSLVTFFFKY